MNRATSFALLCVLLLLAGCAGLGNRLGPEKISLPGVPPNTALIILSAGSEKGCSDAPTFLRIHPAGAPFDIGTAVETFAVDYSLVKSDFATHQGSLSVLQVKPGDYYLAPAVVDRNIKTLATRKADISVAAGEVVYLGEYFMSASCVPGGQGTFRDQEARDMALLKQKNPGFANVKVTKRIPAFSGLAIGTGK